MTKPIGFSAFLKLLELNAGPRKTELRKKLGEGGGFQYWRPLQITAGKAILPGADLASLRAEIASLCSGHQRKHNENAFDAFKKWLHGKAVLPVEPLPRMEVPFGNSGLVVRLQPEVSFALDNSNYGMALWATTKPPLSVQALSVGLFFLAAAYKAKQHNRQFLILDTTKNKLFRESDILPSAIHLLKDKVDAFKKDWDDLNSTPTKPSDRPSPITPLPLNERK